MTNTNFYFASDGSYGDAGGLEIHDTFDWTDAMWEEIESATDNRRPELSDHFAKNEHELDGDKQCIECGLGGSDLPPKND